jgi:hypothetical protein
MTPRINFAPVSSAQSSLLRFASGYFLLNGVLYGILVAVRLIAYASGRVVFAPTLPNVVRIFVEVIAAVGLVWTGSLLGRGTRFGGFLALGFVLLPLVFAALSLQHIRAVDLVFGIFGVIVFAIIWRELR